MIFVTKRHAILENKYNISVVVTYITHPIRAEDFRFQPRKVVDSHPILLSWYSHQYVLSLQNLHLLESTSWDQLINLSLTTAIQQHQTILCPNQQVHTCVMYHRIPFIQQVWNLTRQSQAPAHIPLMAFKTRAKLSMWLHCCWPSSWFRISKIKNCMPVTWLYTQLCSAGGIINTCSRIYCDMLKYLKYLFKYIQKSTYHLTQNYMLLHSKQETQVISVFVCKITGRCSVYLHVCLETSADCRVCVQEM